MRKVISTISVLAFILISLSLTSSRGLKVKSILKPEIKNNEKIENCKFKGFKLYGKVKIVSDFPDIKVKIVENFPDIKVQVVDNFPDKCGKWKFVEDFPDIKVQFVENFADIKVKFVENFPGEVK